MPSNNIVISSTLSIATPAFPTSDGARVMIVALTPKQWSALVHVCGIADPVRELEARLGTDLGEEGARYLHRDAIAALVGPWVAARPLAEIGRASCRERVCQYV